MARGHDLTIITRPDGTQIIEGTGILRNKGRTKWMMRYHDPATNLPVKRTTGTADERQAMRVWTAVMAERDKGAAVGPGMDKITLDEAYQARVADYRHNQRKTMRQLEYRYRCHLKPFFGGGTKMHQITEGRIVEYIDHRFDEGASRATVNRETDNLRSMFRLAQKQKRLSTVPHIPKHKERNTRKGFFEEPAFNAVRAKLREKVLQNLLTVAYITGWRVAAELLTLEWRQVDFTARTLTLDPDTTKNDEGRIFPLTAELYDALRDQRDEADRLAAAGVITPYVFFRTYATKRGGAAKTSPRRAKRVKRFKTAWDKAGRAAGQPGHLLHDLRRTAVRNMVRRGVPERVAMQLTGHLTRSVFERYNIVSPGDLLEAADKLAGLGAPTPVGGQIGGQNEENTGVKKRA